MISIRIKFPFVTYLAKKTTKYFAPCFFKHNAKQQKIIYINYIFYFFMKWKNINAQYWCNIFDKKFSFPLLFFLTYAMVTTFCRCVQGAIYRVSQTQARYKNA